ncbi:LysM peptidoglycan-binding domain-containing protein [Pseudidiomarina taiwanensis]|nr:LysM domain-containing protein [Pseudidiomarina taiwanensis]
MASWRFSAIAAIGFLAATALAQPAYAFTETTAAQQRGDIIRLKEGAPTEYVVKKGDTLWDISALFLNDPWLWPELWRVNETIANPHLIYPGDRLYLVWRDGRPQLTRKAQRTLLPEGAVALKPDPLKMFPYDALAPFLTHHVALTAEAIAAAPVILGDNRGAPRINGMTPVFIEGKVQVGERYQIFSPTAALEQGALLRHVGDVAVTLQQSEQLFEGEVSSPKREIRRGDVVLPVQQSPLPEMLMATPGADLDGYIVAALNERREQGMYDIVVLDRGSRDGVQQGQMYRALRLGLEVFRDEAKPRAVNRYHPTDDLSRLWRETTQLPPATTAEMMVIAVQQDTSFAVVLRSREWLSIGDYFVPVKW